MKKTLIVVIIALLGFAISLNAQKTPDKENKFYCNIEILETASFNLPEKLNKKVLFETGLNLAMGYEFNRYLTLAGGIGFNTLEIGTKNMKNSFPVFVRLHSEFLDKKVTPYAELDLGWNFVCGESYSEKINYGENINDAHTIKKEDLVNGEKPLLDEKSGKYMFNDNTNIYLDIDYNKMIYIPDGLFAKLTLGTSIKAGEHKVNIGVTGALSQYFLGRWVSEPFTDRIGKYGQVVEILKPGEVTDPDNLEQYKYIKSGRNNFFSLFKPSVSIKLGFTF